MKALFSRDTALKLLLMGLATVVGLLAGELMLRAALDEVNYLAPELVDHPELRHAIEPGTGGHDSWGFRNSAVPSTVYSVSIGDSQTYGWAATAEESWPSWLSRISDRSVYNLALGGYGPVDYEYLFHHRALDLQPNIVIFGLYLGNDLIDAHRAATRNSRSESQAGNDDANGGGGGNARLLQGARAWLSRHAMLYQVLKYHAHSLVSLLRFREAKSVGGGRYVVLDADPIRTVFDPDPRLRALSLKREKVREGLEITLQVLLRLDRTCVEHGVRCHYLIIPTKESVYANEARRYLAGDSWQRISEVVNAEEAVRDSLLRFAEANDMSYIDPLPKLREAATERAIYQGNEGGHPIGAGYRVIAEAVAEALSLSRSPEQPFRGSSARKYPHLASKTSR